MSNWGLKSQVLNGPPYRLDQPTRPQGVPLKPLLVSTSINDCKPEIQWPQAAFLGRIASLDWNLGEPHIDAGEIAMQDSLRTYVDNPTVMTRTEKSEMIRITRHPANAEDFQLLGDH